MTFLWPDMLWLLVALPALAGVYAWLLRRRNRAALHYTNLGLVREALGPGQRIRRHLPPLLLLLGVGVLIVAAARPRTVVTLPFDHETVIMAMDVSLSMSADDVPPTRLDAAKSAAREFVSEQVRGARIGLVSFAGTASLVQPPTREHESVLAAIDGLEVQRATAVGSAILVSLKAIFPDLDVDLLASDPRRDVTGRGRARGAAIDAVPDAAKPKARPTKPGSYKSAVIILLSDGQTTTGPDPIEAARIAADSGVRVFTVGFGTPNGEVSIGDRYRFRVRLDEDALKAIADVTGAEYSYAGTAADLRHIYQKLHARLVLERKETEISALFSAGAAVLAVLAGMLSLAWFHRGGR